MDLIFLNLNQVILIKKKQIQQKYFYQFYLPLETTSFIYHLYIILYIIYILFRANEFKMIVKVKLAQIIFITKREITWESWTWSSSSFLPHSSIDNMDRIILYCENLFLNLGIWTASLSGLHPLDVLNITLSPKFWKTWIWTCKYLGVAWVENFPHVGTIDPVDHLERFYLFNNFKKQDISVTS